MPRVYATGPKTHVCEGDEAEQPAEDLHRADRDGRGLGQATGRGPLGQAISPPLDRPTVTLLDRPTPVLLDRPTPVGQLRSLRLRGRAFPRRLTHSAPTVLRPRRADRTPPRFPSTRPVDRPPIRRRGRRAAARPTPERRRSLRTPTWTGQVRGSSESTPGPVLQPSCRAPDPIRPRESRRPPPSGTATAGHPHPTEMPPERPLPRAGCPPAGSTRSGESASLSVPRSPVWTACLDRPRVATNCTNGAPSPETNAMAANHSPDAPTPESPSTSDALIAAIAATPGNALPPRPAAAQNRTPLATSLRIYRRRNDRSSISPLHSLQRLPTGAPRTS